MTTNNNDTAANFVRIPIADAKPGDHVNNGEIERVSFLNNGRTVCISFIGGGHESYPSHFTPYVRRPIIDTPAAAL